LPRDRRDILRICARTWHGWDYVPQFLNRWLKDKGFYVLVERPVKSPAEERVVGLGKFTELSPGELWLEGLRIDPETRNQGLGWRLSQYVIRAALAEKPRSIRLATGRRNTHSRRIIRRMGLRLKVSFWNREGRIPKRPGRPKVFRPDSQAAWDYLRRSEEFRASKGLLGHTWQFRTASLELIEELCRRGRVFGFCAAGTSHRLQRLESGPESVKSAESVDKRSDKHGNNLQGLLILQPGRYANSRLDISFIGGERKALPEFARQIRVFAGQHKCRRIGGMAAGPRMLRHFGGLRMRGWRGAGNRRTTLVYEYPLSARQAAIRRNARPV
jgi:GNAT superfamily N-acetyltransferase